jgi:hypothetical protein
VCAGGRPGAPDGLLGLWAPTGRPEVALPVGGMGCTEARGVQRPECIRAYSAGAAQQGPAELHAGCAVQLRVRAAACGAHGGGTGQHSVGCEFWFRASLHPGDAQDAASVLSGAGGDAGEGVGEGNREAAAADAQPCGCVVERSGASPGGERGGCVPARAVGRPMEFPRGPFHAGTCLPGAGRTAQAYARQTTAAGSPTTQMPGHSVRRPRDGRIDVA